MWQTTRKLIFYLVSISRKDTHYLITGNLNLRVRYHHIPLDDDSIPVAAFISLVRKYEYLKVPFRLAQVPTYFQELMNKVLKDLLFAIVYLNDIIIYSKTIEKHLDKKFFHKLCNVKLSMKLSKCHFFTKEIQYLSHVLSTTSIKPLPFGSNLLAVFLLEPFHDHIMVLPFIPCPFILTKVLSTFVSNPSSDEGCLEFILSLIYPEVVICNTLENRSH